LVQLEDNAPAAHLSKHKGVVILANLHHHKGDKRPPSHL